MIDRDRTPQADVEAPDAGGQPSWSRLRADLGELIGSLREVGRAEGDRIVHQAQKLAFRVALALAAGLAGMLMLVAGIVYLARGLAGAAAAALGGRVWAGELVAGAIGVAGFALFLGLRRWQQRRRLVARLRDREASTS